MENSYGECLAGIDDGFFEKSWKRTLLCLALHCFNPARGLVPIAAYLEPVTVDGLDATESAKRLVERAKKKYFVEAVFTDTIVFAGFNILNPKKLYEETKIPVITVNKYPHNKDRIQRALVKHFPDYARRLSLLEENWSRQKTATCSKGSVLIAAYGLSYSEAWSLLCKAQVYSREPEPLYTAGLLASTATRTIIAAKHKHK